MKLKIYALILAITLISTLSFAEEKVNKNIDVYDPSGKLSSFACTIGDKAYIKIVSGIGMMDVANLWTDMRYLEDVAKVKEIELLIMSPGGDGMAGLAIADEIERVIKRGVKVNAYASGLIASAAVPIFAVCSTRVASPGTIFMVHEPQIFKFISSEKRKDLQTQSDMMNLLVDKYVGRLAERSNLTKDEWEKKGLETTWFTAQDALKWGLVDRIE